MNQDARLRLIEQLAKDTGAARLNHFQFIDRPKARVIIRALGTISRESKADLLSRPEDEMVFLSNAVIANDKTAYPVLVSNYKMLLSRRAPIVPKVRKGNLVSAVHSALKASGFSCTKSSINTVNDDRGKVVSVVVEAGFPAVQLSRFKQSLMNKYDFHGSLPNVTMEDAGERRGKKFVALSFVIKSERKANA